MPLSQSQAPAGQVPNPRMDEGVDLGKVRNMLGIKNGDAVFWIGQKVGAGGAVPAEFPERTVGRLGPGKRRLLQNVGDQPAGNGGTDAVPV